MMSTPPDDSSTKTPRRAAVHNNFFPNYPQCLRMALVLLRKKIKVHSLIINLLYARSLRNK